MHVPVGAALLVALTLAFTASAQAQTVTIQVTSLTTVITPHDTKPKGKPNKGDSIFFKDLLINKLTQFGKKKGKAVAYDIGVLSYTTATRTRMSVTATFPGVGTITYAGEMVTRKNGETVLKITGGTGGFKGATGTVTIGPGATTAPNTYRVTVPGHPLNIHGSTGGVA